MLDENEEQEYEDSAADTGLFADVFEEVRDPATEEMLLGPGYVSYGGEPQMDTQSLQMWLGLLPLADVEITQLTFNGVDPFFAPFA